MKATAAFLVLWSVVALGCGPKGDVGRSALPGAIDIPARPVDRERESYDQFRKGTYQFQSALDTLTSANQLSLDLSRRAGGTASQGFKEILRKLDAAGHKLGDYTDDPPSYEQFKADFSVQDEHRLDAIDEANDALGDLADAQDLVDALLATAPAEYKPDVQKIQDQLDETVDAIESGVTAMGGKLDPENSPDSSSETPLASTTGS